MTLKDTSQLMLSRDYKKRFRAEYFQLKIRLTRLNIVIDKVHKDKLSFIPNCPISLLEDQAVMMTDLLDILTRRAHIENISLEP